MGRLTVGDIYRPPSRSVESFMHTLQEFFNQPNLKCIIAGDFNINLLSNGSADFVNFIHEFSFYCSVNTATYFSPIKLDETSCLDHVWHNLLYKTQTFVISPPIADHLSVASFIDYPIPDTKKTAYFR